jgi:hypothetical protein
MSEITRLRIVIGLQLFLVAVLTYKLLILLEKTR